MKAKSLISRVAVISGLALGAFALSAVAGSWTAPSLPPPDGNVDAPINVGSIEQHKIGLFGLLDLAVSHSFSYATSSAAAGKYLKAIDSNGTAVWDTPSGSGVSSVSCPGTKVMVGISNGVAVCKDLVFSVNTYASNGGVNESKAIGIHTYCALAGADAAYNTSVTGSNNGTQWILSSSNSGDHAKAVCVDVSFVN